MLEASVFIAKYTVYQIEMDFSFTVAMWAETNYIIDHRPLRFLTLRIDVKYLEKSIMNEVGGQAYQNIFLHEHNQKEQTCAGCFDFIRNGANQELQIQS